MLADAITRSQRENGMIPTYWMDEEYLNGKNLWINCMFSSALALEDISLETENNKATPHNSTHAS